MAAEAQHEYAVYLFQQESLHGCGDAFGEVLREEETGERWSDWATVQFALRNFAEAERGFRRALQLNPNWTDAP